MKISVLGILQVVLGVTVCIVIYILLTHKRADVQTQKEASFKKQYDSSQKVIDSLVLKIKSEETVITNLKSFDSLLSDKYKDKKKEIAQLEQEASKPSPVIKKYSVKQLDSAFAARYPSDTAKGDSIVTLQKSVGVNSLQDLIRYDTLAKVIPLYKYNDSLLNLILTDKDSIITVKDKQIRNYNQMVTNYGSQQKVLMDERAQDKAVLKKAKRNAVVASVASGILAVLLILK